MSASGEATGKAVSHPLEVLGLRTMAREYEAAMFDLGYGKPGHAMTQKYFRRYAIQAESAPNLDEQIACRKGCSYCCHTRVAAPAHEVFALADSIASMPTEQQARIVERIADNAALIAGMDASTHQRTPVRCALLNDQGACSAYDERPSSCRRNHSLSRADCETSFSQPEETGDRVRLSTRHLVVGMSQYLGFRKVLVERGFDMAHYELNTALHEAITHPQATRDRWAERMPTFTEAAVCVKNGDLL